MNDLTKNIELIYDDELVLEGEQLWLKSHVENLSCPEKGLYIAQVHDDENYEIEISSPFAKKQKISCECEYYKSNHICKHIIAGLYAIQEEIKKTKELKLKNKKTKPVALNINQIIKDIEPEDLKTFIRSYAKIDKRFSTQLKVSFARKIDLADNIEKYKNILDSIVKPVTTTDQKLSVSDLKYILRVLDELASQINDCIALNHYREGLNIFIASFSKLEYVRSRYNLNHDELKPLSKIYHQMIGYFFESKLPTELKKELIAFLTDFMQRSYYKFDDYHNNILFYLLPKLNNAERNEIKDVLYNLPKTRPVSEHAVILAYYIKIQKKYTKEAADFFTNNPLQLIEVVNLLLVDENIKIALEILEKTYKSRPKDKDVINRLLYLYVQAGSRPQLIELSRKAYFNWGDIKYLEILKKELKESQYTQVILGMETQFLTNYETAPDTALRFFKFENNWAGMVLYLEKKSDINLIQKYDTFIYSHDKQAIADVYIRSLDELLKNQLGDTPQFLLEKLLAHWKNNSMKTVIQEVGNFLKKEYGHRTKLLEIFP